MATQHNDRVDFRMGNLQTALTYTPQPSGDFPSPKAAEAADWLAHILSKNETGQFMSPATRARAERLHHLCSESVYWPLSDLVNPALDAVKYGRHEIESLIRINGRNKAAGLKWNCMAKDYIVTRYAPYSKEIENKRRKMESQTWRQLFNGRKSVGPIVKCPYETSAIFAVMDWVDIDRILDFETRENSRWTEYPGISAFVDFSTKIPGRQPPSKLTSYLEDVAKAHGDLNWGKVRKFIKMYIAQRYPASSNLYTETDWFESPLLFSDIPNRRYEIQNRTSSPAGSNSENSNEAQGQRGQKFDEDSRALSEWTPSCCSDYKVLAIRAMGAF
ncbi:hypothetical protein COL5a_009602 [Colletotrichum fioriniae]|uniref:uncharacterized protein n=1 Tax=Colletotrichum fioriniae TaxID=710243 RepID=UPI0023011B0C|nr:uncharacterized protein COL516b_009865 [Colletotrichum fioriniae]KAJ0298484.1 hypothetical protein COL516b_009865 [Colletotrichum fioriniae]KAJ0320748.1 hypothetical protein COL5a_009602 [Colletotrichum fioriniae]KAJ3940145.1 hypothetical protein N0V96_010156 [Colletotrichum fioriniae]